MRSLQVGFKYFPNCLQLSYFYNMFKYPENNIILQKYDIVSTSGQLTFYIWQN